MAEREVDAVLRDLVSVFGDKITAAEIERTVQASGPKIKVRVEVLSLRDLIGLHIKDDVVELGRIVPRYQ